MRHILVKLDSLMHLCLQRLQRWYFRKLLGAPTLELYFPSYIRPLRNVVIGERVAIGAFVHILANERVTIGDDTIIAASVQITTSTHDVSRWPYRDHRRDVPIKIGNNVWIGAGAVILPGVTIGDNCIIGAGSVVTRDVPAGAVFAGVPARKLRDAGHAD